MVEMDVVTITDQVQGGGMAHNVETEQSLSLSSRLVRAHSGLHGG